MENTQSPAPASAIADVDIEAEVISAIEHVKTIRPTRSEIHVQVTGGQVTLTGFVPSPMACTEIERAVRRVPGVTALHDQLVDDGSLTRQVALLLATDPHTRGIPGYQLGTTYGHLNVVGRLTEAQQAAITAVAQTVPGVRGTRFVSVG